MKSKVKDHWCPGPSGPTASMPTCRLCTLPGLGRSGGFWMSEGLSLKGAVTAFSAVHGGGGPLRAEPVLWTQHNQVRTRPLGAGPVLRTAQESSGPFP